MTDSEIIKALECLCGGGDSCTECAYHKKYRFDECRKQVVKDALDLINRQQVEIEELKIENKSLRSAANSYKMHFDVARTEAVKEFAESLNEKVENARKKYQRLCKEQGEKEDEAMNIHFKGIIKLINNLVKEKVGDTE